MKVLSNFLDIPHVSGFSSENLTSQWRVIGKLNFNHIHDGGVGWEEQGRRQKGRSTIFSPVTFTNLGISPQIY